MPFAIAAGVAAGAGIAAGAAVTVGAVAAIAAGVATAASLVMTVVGLATGDKGLMQIAGYVGLAGGLVGGAASLGTEGAAAAADAAGAAAANASTDTGALQAASAAAANGDSAAVANLQSVADQTVSGASNAYDAGYNASINSSIMGTGNSAINNSESPTSTALGAAKSAPVKSAPVQTITPTTPVSTPNSSQSWLDFMKAPSSNGTGLAQVATGALQGLNQQNNLQTQNDLIAQNNNFNQYMQKNALYNANSPGSLNLTVAPVDPASAQAYKLAQAKLASKQSGILATG